MKYEHYRQVARTGDLVFVSGTGLASDIIRTFSPGPWSHVGMVMRASPGRVPAPLETDTILFLESTKAPSARDIHSGKFVRGVRLVPFSDMLRYEWNRESKLGVRTLNNYLRAEQFELFNKGRHRLLGRPYERKILEIWRSAWDGWLGQNETALHSVFCSELVAQMLIWMKLMAPDRPSNEYTPNDFASPSLFTFPMLAPWGYRPLRPLTL